VRTTTATQDVLAHESLRLPVDATPDPSEESADLLVPLDQADAEDIEPVTDDAGEDDEALPPVPPRPPWPPPPPVPPEAPFPPSSAEPPTPATASSTWKLMPVTCNAAVAKIEPLRAFLRQGTHERSSFDEARHRLAELVGRGAA